MRKRGKSKKTICGIGIIIGLPIYLLPFPLKASQDNIMEFSHYTKEVRG